MVVVWGVGSGAVDDDETDDFDWITEVAPVPPQSKQWPSVAGKYSAWSSTHKWTRDVMSATVREAASRIQRKR